MLASGQRVTVACIAVTDKAVKTLLGPMVGREGTVLEVRDSGPAPVCVLVDDEATPYWFKATELAEVEA